MRCCARSLAGGSRMSASPGVRARSPRSAVEGATTRPREEQLVKAKSPTVATLAGRSTLVSALQPMNAPKPIERRPSEKLSVVRQEQPRNAAKPIEARPAGRLMYVREAQPWNASSPIEVTPAGRSSESREVHLRGEPRSEFFCL